MRRPPWFAHLPNAGTTPAPPTRRRGATGGRKGRICRKFKLPGAGGRAFVAWRVWYTCMVKIMGAAKSSKAIGAFNTVRSICDEW